MADDVHTISHMIIICFFQGPSHHIYVCIFFAIRQDLNIFFCSEDMLEVDIRRLKTGTTVRVVCTIRYDMEQYALVRILDLDKVV